jgi:endonuclease YncB( thermonuclease family)
VRDGDTIEAGGTVITLSGIKAHDIDEKCKDGTGRTWPCGARARAALTRLIHGRAVSCVTPSSGKQESFTARCKVGRTDLSVWMVNQGWAEPAAPKDSTLAGAAEAAKKKKLGIWR